MGGRKYAITMLGMMLTPLLALLRVPPEAYMAVATMVIAFCGGNAVVEWKHASRTGAPAPQEG